jgi:hypothetical protein
MAIPGQYEWYSRIPRNKASHLSALSTAVANHEGIGTLRSCCFSSLIMHSYQLQVAFQIKIEADQVVGMLDGAMNKQTVPSARET